MDRLCKSELCTGCGSCAAVCPRECIQMKQDEEGFLRPAVDTEKCIECNLCQRVCPIMKDYSMPDGRIVAYAAINADEQTRFDSTSGGVFTLLSHWVLDRGGIVFGASYDKDFNVVHCAVEAEKDLNKLRGAKYAQSKLGDTFRQVQVCLKAGRYVLFSGTPCQVGGLVSYLGKGYERLILVDLICHGVPSPKVWQHYVNYRREQDAYGEKPISINLRSKQTGWPGYSIRFYYPEGTVYSAPNSEDPYLRGFVGNLYLRPSCHDCQFKGITRQSDFTLGDYWGVWSQLPEYHDGKGTSLVLLHTEKASAIWKDLSAKMRFSKVNPSEALMDNPSALSSSSYSQVRECFFRRYKNEDFFDLVQELYPKPVVKKLTLLQRIIRKLRHIITAH